MPEYWIGKKARVTIIDEQEEPPIKTKKELNSELTGFQKHTRAAARIARKNISYSPEESQ